MTKNEPVRRKPKFHAADLAVDALVVAGVTAPIWSNGSTGYSGAGSVAAGIRRQVSAQTAITDAAYNIEHNALASLPTAAVLVGTGIAIKKALSYLRKRGMLRGVPL